MSRGSYYRWNKKDTVDGMRSLSISHLVKKEMIALGHGQYNRSMSWRNQQGEVTSSIGYESTVDWEGHGYLGLRYTVTNSGNQYDYKIRISATKPHYGGLRLWFHCPKCQKRLGKLYSRGAYVCRGCADLSYDSRQQRPAFRYLDQAQKIHIALGGDGCEPGCYTPPKPKGMHWKTYRRKVEKLAYYSDKADLHAFFMFGQHML